MLDCSCIRRVAVLRGILVLAAITPVISRADILSDNLENTTAGTEIVAAGRWLAASFGNNSTTNTLSAVTLLLANPTPGTAALQLHANGGLEPGALIATLTPPAEYPSALDSATFTASGTLLAPNTTYWIVLRAQSGQFNWAWTADNSGAGAGFQHTWGFTTDSGASWYTYDVYPTQCTVEINLPAPCSPCDTNCDGSTNLFDIEGFVALLSPAPPVSCAPCTGDANNDGSVNLFDITWFVDCLSG